ncbi:MAG: hypothetical protein CMJ16_01870 [Peredibacter sp.]|nr:hypothetical protein [Peredibacter sp.]
MLDPSLDYLKKIFKTDKTIVFHSDVLKEDLPLNVFEFLGRENIFKTIEEIEVNERQLAIKRNGVLVDYTAYYEDGFYLLEPEEDELPILRVPKGELVVGEVSRENLLSALRVKNEFSSSSYRMLLPKDHHFVGEKVLGDKNIKWIISGSRVEKEIIQKIQKDLNKVGCDLLIVSVLDEKKGIDHIDIEGVGIEPLRANLIIDPKVLLKTFSTVECLNYIQIEKYPIFIDQQFGHVYFQGKKVNPGERSELYKYLVALFQVPSLKAIPNNSFCTSWYQVDGKSYEVLKERNNELRKQLKRLYGKNSAQYKYYSTTLICSERGMVKTELESEDIFWWPQEPSTYISP